MRKALAGIASLLGILLVPALAQSQQSAAPGEQWQGYEAARAKSILELQPFRTEERAVLDDGTEVRLIALNPHVNASFLIVAKGEAFHIDNSDPSGQKLALSGGPVPSVSLSGTSGDMRCDLFSGAPEGLRAARESELPYAPICNGRLYLRNQVSGSRSNLERVTDFLRDHVWQGEEIVRVVRDTLYRDQFAVNSEIGEASGDVCVEGGPCAAAIDARYAGSGLAPSRFGIAFGRQDQKEMLAGGWYRALGLDGIYVSAIQPRMIAREILDGPGAVNRLDGIEGSAAVYLIAFDLDVNGLGFALGTDHPRLDWSPRPQASARIRGLPGPDGIADARPLVRSGMVSPEYADRTVATFAGGFKRQHGAFKFGDYATTDTGKHYGFIEKGVIYSKLKTGLSTLFVLEDGTIGMKAWTEADDALLPRIMFARQNGVPLVVTDPATGDIRPGGRVNQWGPGNWSGSAKTELRTLRAGACLQHHQGRSYLIYGYFSTATPSAMARTFQAYSCAHAMLLDMNAPELTYLALYPRGAGKVQVEHLTTEMAQFDKAARDGTVIPRFLGYPDSRDLFFVYQREANK